MYLVLTKKCTFKKILPVLIHTRISIFISIVSLLFLNLNFNTCQHVHYSIYNNFRFYVPRDWTIGKYDNNK